jgi:hypothetical protein
MKFWLTLPGLVALIAAPAAAQIDYRNLDDERPVAVEDAYPLERYAFELLGGYRFARIPGGGGLHLLVPELSYGVARAASIGVKAPLAITTRRGAGDLGLAGVRLFGLCNLTTERPSLPGLALRLDATLPVGGEAGHGAGGMIQALATRSFGRNRLHVNAGAALFQAADPGVAEEIPRWRAGLAVDRTLIRSSILLLAAVTAEQETSGAATTLTAAAGFRRQLTPALVVDAGISWAVEQGARPLPGLTVGLSHAFAIAGLMPGGAP